MSEPLTLPDLVPGRMYDVQHIGVVEFKRWDDYMGQRTAELRGITYPGTYNLLPEDFLAQVNAKRGMAAGEAAIAAYAEQYRAAVVQLHDAIDKFQEALRENPKQPWSPEWYDLIAAYEDTIDVAESAALAKNMPGSSNGKDADLNQAGNAGSSPAPRSTPNAALTVSCLRQEGYKLAMALLQSDLWRTLEDDVKEAARAFFYCPMCERGAGETCCRESIPRLASGCNPDPRAPHGFDRQASHAEDRYVCECESWEAPVVPRVEDKQPNAEQLRFMVEMLRAAKCPAPRCVGGSIISTGPDPQNDQCEWCYYRDESVKAFGNKAPEGDKP